MIEPYVNLAGMLLFLLSLVALVSYADGRIAAAGVLSLFIILAATLFLVRR